MQFTHTDASLKDCRQRIAVHERRRRRGALDSYSEKHRPRHRLGRSTRRPFRSRLGCRTRLLFPPWRLGSWIWKRIRLGRIGGSRSHTETREGWCFRTTGKQSFETAAGESRLRTYSFRSRDRTLLLRTPAPHCPYFASSANCVITTAAPCSRFSGVGRSRVKNTLWSGRIFAMVPCLAI